MPPASVNADSSASGQKIGEAIAQQSSVQIRFGSKFGQPKEFQVIGIFKESLQLADAIFSTRKCLFKKSGIHCG
ncbi:MAG: hypothetical protein V4710_03560 [Verrucomicrobiota bacterium]